MSLWQEPPASATTQDSIRDSQLCWRVCPACAVSCGETSALDHLPESVAGAAVFDPMHTRGFNVIQWSIKGGASIPYCTSGTILAGPIKTASGRLRCHPMVHEGRCKHPALHLRYHLQVRLNTAPGRPAQYTVPASVIQAVCIATPGFAGINVACRLYSADELY